MAIIFVCRKCDHHLFVSAKSIEGLSKLLDKTDCPACGEESHMNWIYLRLGEFEREKEYFRRIENENV